ncbi:hypothetical protein [Desulfovibrio falkowii]
MRTKSGATGLSDPAHRADDAIQAGSGAATFSSGKACLFRLTG